MPAGRTDCKETFIQSVPSPTNPLLKSSILHLRVLINYDENEGGMRYEVVHVVPPFLFLFLFFEPPF